MLLLAARWLLIVGVVAVAPILELRLRLAGNGREARHGGSLGVSRCLAAAEAANADDATGDGRLALAIVGYNNVLVMMMVGHHCWTRAGRSFEHVPRELREPIY